jgi:hypothetical protein
MNPFAAEGIWLKVQMHCHTTNSDGEHTPEEAVALYEEAGYDALALTDHWFVTEPPQSDRLVVLTGAELNADAPGRRAGCHVLTVGIPAPPDDEASSFPSLEAAASWARAAGGLAFLSHPYWSGLWLDALEGADELAGVEAFNAVCEKICGRGRNEFFWDAALESGRALPAIAVDDAHRPEDVDRAWTWLRARARDAGAILEALAAGAMYGSTGPRIHEVRVEDDAVVVECDPCAGAILTSRRERGASAWAGDRPRSRLGEVLATDGHGLLTAARLHVEEPDLPYLRVVVRDARGGEAWTGPL